MSSRRTPGTAPAEAAKAETASGRTRREFLRETTLYGGSLWIALSLPRPQAARAAAASSQPAALSPAEWRTLEAITGRILPTDQEPGAIEAGCVNFIDKALAHEDAAARPLYALGLAGTDAVARHRFGRPFVLLAAEEQDQVLVALEQGGAPGWPEGAPASAVFFASVRAHTVIGFLADPKYGGNRDFVGWKLVGYPGPRHHLGGYRPDQMLGKAKLKTIWGEEL
jgi:gluconate 2-dehydrogenase gamma chain